MIQRDFFKEIGAIIRFFRPKIVSLTRTYMIRSLTLHNVLLQCNEAFPNCVSSSNCHITITSNEYIIETAIYNDVIFKDLRID